MLRRLPVRRCYFAPKPPAAAPALLEFAAALHGGHGIYHRRDDVLSVLRAIQDTNPTWWCEECSEFVDRVSDDAAGATLQRADRHAIIVCEGLDAVGKTTVTSNLAAKLDGVVVRTPHPRLDAVRGRFRVLEEPLARAFYCGANYLAATEILAASMDAPVIVDRWWGSTCASALANNDADLPPRDESVYAWPADLPEFDLGVVLDVQEDIRLKRIAKRGDQNQEEAVLAANAALRRKVLDAYDAMGGYEHVMVPTYMVAINEIFEHLRRAGVGQPGNARLRKLPRPYTAAEQATCKPY